MRTTGRRLDDLEADVRYLTRVNDLTWQYVAECTKNKSPDAEKPEREEWQEQVDLMVNLYHRLVNKGFTAEQAFQIVQRHPAAKWERV